MGVLLLTLLTASSCVASRYEVSAQHKIVLAKVQSALEELDSLSMVAQYDEQTQGGMAGQSQRGTARVRALMAHNGRFRVTGFADDEQPTAEIVYDGRVVTEWSATENTWTRYPPGKGGSPWICRRLLVSDWRLLQHAESWLGENNALCDSIRRAAEKAKRVSVDTQVLNDQTCDRFVIRHTQHQGAMTMKMRYEFYFDGTTHLPVKRVMTMNPKLLFFSVGERTRVVQYHDVRPNVPISDKMFSFKPPEGAQFIPPDDPRLRSHVPVGQPAPPLDLPTMDGRTVRLGHYIGKKAVLLSFWSTACAPCLREMPTLCKLHDEFHEKGLAVVGVSLGGTVNRLKSFLKARPLPYTVLHDADASSRRRYYLRGIPHTILIDKQGIVVRIWQGWDDEQEEKEIRDAIAKLGIHR